MKRIGIAVMLTLATAAAIALVLTELDLSREPPHPASAPTPKEAGTDALDTAALRLRQERGKYLAQVANCMGCHTAQGGQLYAGGKELPTPFGTFITSNITPDKSTGIGNWNEQDFWKALHEGKSRDGRALYPAFPYT
jgi:mono/diheme cytochrome c family protein